MITEGPTLGDLPEDALLAEILPLFADQPGSLVGPGDDAAVLAGAGPVVATTDTMVRGRDWLDAWSSPADVGAKLLAQNLADVAAMGAVPTSVLVTLVADPATPAAWALDFARSLGAAAADCAVAVAGGDLSSAPAGTLVVSMTALGDLQGRAPVLRSGARVGDVVALCGSLGRSAAGLALLEAAGRGPGDAAPRAAAAVAVPEAAPRRGAAGATRDGIRQACLDHHRRPVVPLRAGPAAADAGATAMIDISDGLLRDAHRVARASRVRIELSSAALEPYLRDLEPLLGPGARECVLAGGEEHSLLATFPPAAVPTDWQPIGVVRDGSGVSLDSVPQEPRGWDHFGPGVPG